MIFKRKKKEEKGIEDIEEELKDIEEMPLELEEPKEEAIEMVEERPKKEVTKPPEPTYAYATMEDVERLVEAIVEEKWKKVDMRLVEFENKIKSTESKITSLSSKLAELERVFSEIQARIAEREKEHIDEMKEVKTSLKAMEKILSEFVPQFTDGIRDVRELIKVLKEKV